MADAVGSSLLSSGLSWGRVSVREKERMRDTGVEPPRCHGSGATESWGNGRVAGVMQADESFSVPLFLLINEKTV